jgi:hypothetical protein
MARPSSIEVVMLFYVEQVITAQDRLVAAPSPRTEKALDSAWAALCVRSGGRKAAEVAVARRIGFSAAMVEAQVTAARLAAKRRALAHARR